MFLTKPDLTAGSRPTLFQDEVLLFVQDAVGLYEGKYKVDSCQKGHAYLTSHRACYVDDAEPRANSWAVDLKDVDRHEHQAGFLRSSAKITMFPKPLKRGFSSISRPSAPQTPQFQRLLSSSTPGSRSASPFRPQAISPAPAPAASGTWVCPICSFSNPVPSNFDPTIATEAFPLPPCLACGIRPPFSVVLKAAVVANAKRIPSSRPQSVNLTTNPQVQSYDDGSTTNVIICPRCTFHNHAWLRECELCSASLPALDSGQTAGLQESFVRSESPGPEISGLTLEEEHESPSVKFSFRSGGDRVFYDRLKDAMIQRKWLLQYAPPIPRADSAMSAPPLSTGSPPPAEMRTAVGIAGLEQRGLRTRKNNEAVLGCAFEDLQALMASAKDIVALAERFAQESGAGPGPLGAGADPLLSQSAAALGMVATKDLLGEGSNTLYISELSRNLAEYATDDRRGILQRQGGTMSLVDLWAMFNRSQNGVELVSPADFHKATEAWERLGLPVKLRRFRSGLLVVQQRHATDERTISHIKAWLESLKYLTAEATEPWDRTTFSIGITAQDAAARFGWSLGVASEELEMAEEKGALCREESVEGLKFWLNFLLDEEEQI